MNKCNALTVIIWRKINKNITGISLGISHFYTAIREI